MKWQNKGHEFDELGAIFQKNSALLLIGTKEENAELKKKLEFLDVSIETISNFLVGSKKTLLGKMFLLITSYIMAAAIKRKIEKICNGRIIIINYPSIISNRLIPFFEKTGNYLKNSTVFSVADFVQKYLSIFALYVCNKVYLYNIGITVTTVCNLNCTYCLNFNAYNKNLRHISLDELKQECDAVFRNVDKLMHFSVSGGEPFLYPQFGALLRYINEKYRNKIEYLGPATNGTIVPSDELSKIFHDCDVTIICDNYITVKKTRATYRKVIKQLQKFNIKYHEGIIRRFFKTFPPEKDWRESTGRLEFIDKYDRCGSPNFKVHFTDVKNGRLYGCCYTSFAETAGLIKATVDDYFDLNTILNDAEKKELVEFKLGYCNKGCVSFCQYCNQLTCSKLDDGVEQTKGKLYWDINNPTQMQNGTK